MSAPSRKGVFAEAERISKLSEREREVSLLVAEGLSNKQIGERCFISTTTVRHHLTAIFVKLEITSRFELIAMFFRHGLVTPPGPPMGPTRPHDKNDTDLGRSS